MRHGGNMNYFLILLVGAMLLSAACERVKEGEVQTPPAPLGQEIQPGAEIPGGAPITAPSVNVANVVLNPKAGKAVTFAVEIADTPEARRQGLMGRESLAEKHGMWFVFENDVQDPFWMKDTPVSLDIIFVDKDYNVVDVIANAQPNLEVLLVPKQPYRYVLETKAGTAAAYKLAVGDKVE